MLPVEEGILSSSVTLAGLCCYENSDVDSYILWDPPCQVRGVSLRLAGGQRGIACESGRFCRLAGLGRECRLWLGRSGGVTLGPGTQLLSVRQIPLCDLAGIAYRL